MGYLLLAAAAAVVGLLWYLKYRQIAHKEPIERRKEALKDFIEQEEALLQMRKIVREAGGKAKEQEAIDALNEVDDFIGKWLDAIKE